MVSGTDRGVAKPGFDDVGFDARFQQMNRRCVAQAMRGNLFLCQRRTARGGLFEVFFYQGPYSESGKGSAALVDKESIGGRMEGWAAMPPIIMLKKLNGGGPERSDARPLTFA